MTQPVFSREKRTVLAGQIATIFRSWKLTPEERAWALGFRRGSKLSLRRYENGGAIVNKTDVLWRAGCLLDISRLLLSMDPDHGSEWIRKPCVPLENKRPVELLKHIESMLYVRSMLINRASLGIK